MLHINLLLVTWVWEQISTSECCFRWNVGHEKYDVEPHQVISVRLGQLAIATCRAHVALCGFAFGLFIDPWLTFTTGVQENLITWCCLNRFWKTDMKVIDAWLIFTLITLPGQVAKCVPACVCPFNRDPATKIAAPWNTTGCGNATVT